MNIIKAPSGEIKVDKHDEVIATPEQEAVEIEKGKKIKQVLPHYWDIETDMEQKSFEIEIEFKYDPEELVSLGINEHNLAVIRFNEETGKWQTLSSLVDTVLKVVKVITDHFSTYALAEQEKVWQQITEQISIEAVNVKLIISEMKAATDIAIINETEEGINLPLRAVVQYFDNQTISLLNSDGQTTEAKDYIEYGQAGAILLPWQKTDSRRFEFQLPGPMCFEIEFEVEN